MTDKQAERQRETERKEIVNNVVPVQYAHLFFATGAIELFLAIDPAVIRNAPRVLPVGDRALWFLTWCAHLW